jgi:hypothetical protein
MATPGKVRLRRPRVDMTASFKGESSNGSTTIWAEEGPEGEIAQGRLEMRMPAFWAVIWRGIENSRIVRR